MASSSKSVGKELDENQNLVKDIIRAAVASVITDHVQENPDKSDDVSGSDHEKSSLHGQKRVSAQVEVIPPEEASNVPAQNLVDDKILGAVAFQTTPAQEEENPFVEKAFGSGSEKSSPQSQNRVPTPAQVEETPPAEEVNNMSGSESGSGSEIVRIPVPVVMSKGGDSGQASTSRPRSRGSSPSRSRSRSMASDTRSSSGTGSSKRSRSSSSSSMSSSSASEAPASKRRRPRSSSLSLTTESKSDDRYKMLQPAMKVVLQLVMP